MKPRNNNKTDKFILWQYQQPKIGIFEKEEKAEDHVGLQNTNSIESGKSYVHQCKKNVYALLSFFFFQSNSFMK